MSIIAGYRKLEVEYVVKVMFKIYQIGPMSLYVCEPMSKHDLTTTYKYKNKEKRYVNYFEVFEVSYIKTDIQ